MHVRSQSNSSQSSSLSVSQPLSVEDVGQTEGERGNAETPVRVTQEEEARLRDTYGDDGDVISATQEGRHCCKRIEEESA